MKGDNFKLWWKWSSPIALFFLLLRGVNLRNVVLAELTFVLWIKKVFILLGFVIASLTLGGNCIITFLIWFFFFCLHGNNHINCIRPRNDFFSDLGPFSIIFASWGLLGIVFQHSCVYIDEQLYEIWKLFSVDAIASICVNAIKQSLFLSHIQFEIFSLIVKVKVDFFKGQSHGASVTVHEKYAFDLSLDPYELGPLRLVWFLNK